ncbi:MAG TPA: acyl carrier protein [Thermoleophilaceae bacterium]|jgi:acyl carrier protein
MSVTQVIEVEAAVAALRELIAMRRPDVDPDTIHAGTDLDELGLDSLDVAELVTILEERAGAFLDTSSVERIVRVEDLTQLQALPA